MLIADKYELPDSCPKDCKYTGELEFFDQSSICTRCPILVCGPVKMAVDKDGHGPVSEEQADHHVDFCMVKPEGYREDWAKEWFRFFAGEVEEPELILIPEGQKEG